MRYDPLAGNVETVFLESAERYETIPAGTALIWFREDGITGVPLVPASATGGGEAPAGGGSLGLVASGTVASAGG